MIGAFKERLEGLLAQTKQQAIQRMVAQARQPPGGVPGQPAQPPQMHPPGPGQGAPMAAPAPIPPAGMPR